MLIGLLLGYFLLWPVPFDPAPDKLAGKNPAGTGVFAKNNRLAAATLLESGHGPEGIAIDRRGRLYTGLHDGEIVRLDGNTITELANTGGRPLGIEFDARGNLIIADAMKGLLSMAPNGTLTTLATEHDGRRMIFVDDVAIANDGKIYFSDASTKYELGDELAEAFERRPTGRLLVYDPMDDSTKLLLDGLHFANGVALGPRDSYVLVNETFSHRIMRYWLTGAKAGTAEIFAENLPGFIDNITEAPGGFWLAIVAPRTAELDAMVDSPFQRKLVWRLLQLTGGSPVTLHSYAVKLDRGGHPIISLEDDSGHIFLMTSVLEHRGKLYLGSLENHAIGIIAAPR